MRASIDAIAMSAHSDENQNPLLCSDKWTEEKEGDPRGRLCAPPSQCTGVASPLRRKEVRAANRFLLDPDEECEFPGCLTAPYWLQRLATRRTFLFVFCVSSILQGMYYTYFVSVLTTIERLFQIRSQTAGVIMSATEVGQIGGGLLLSYYGGGGHRPRWIGSGMLLFGLSASLCALPHFLFGDALLKEFLASAPSQDSPLSTANICLEHRPSAGEGLVLEALRQGNTSVMALLQEDETYESTFAYSSRIVLSLFFVALLGVGVGQTAVYNLGIPYIDDNVANEESPTYFGMTIGVRILGPTFGFVLGSLCTRLSVDPLSKPKFDPTDPRWIGAWWLGHLIISSSLILTSFIMMMFPKKLPHPPPPPMKAPGMRKLPLSNDNFRSSLTSFEGDISPLTEESLSLESSSFIKSSAKSPSSTRPCSIEIIFDHPEVKNSLKQLEPSSSSSILDHPPQDTISGHCTRHQTGDTEGGELKKVQARGKRSIKDFLGVIHRLLTNQILVLRTVSSVLHLLPIAGLYTFLPKYIETQFRLPVHSAAMISGVGGILVMGFGIFTSGFVIRRLNPSPRTIAGWIALTALLYSLGMIILMFLGCSHYDIQGRIAEDGISLFRPICQRTCSSCNDETFAPICSTEGKTYFSACHAGCTSVTFINNTEEMEFGECECLGPGVKAQLRLCEALCPNLMWYVTVFCFFVIIHSTSEVGGMLVTLRCVSPEDKAMALGLISVAVGLFGNVPCPILYGAVIDYACMHWRESSEGRGACQIYDSDIFRTFFHGTTAFVMFLAFCVDVCVWRSCKGISFTPGKEDGAEDAREDPSSSTLPSNAPSTTLTLDQNEVEPMLSMPSSFLPPGRHKKTREEEEEEEEGEEKSDKEQGRSGGSLRTVEKKWKVS